ncbi:hypothetical protein NON00_04555 [Roseomonas sp. GC11]|uniref:hypothetical protein n=1 Tax=Roseomonas sp. GC11 TaxID=2950546 RepID=UPI00210B7911|nr:hypothetical protein [Roseomonas sp. GC11]MCQ4159192.1 hypothetical protein [Roseomonas sp. GC11]
MTETTEPGRGDPAPDVPAMPIVAQRALAAPATVDRAARGGKVPAVTSCTTRSIFSPLRLSRWA